MLLPNSRLLVRPMLALLLVVVAASAARADDFDIYHPDEHYRRLGLRAWDGGHRDMAVRYLTHAARYADKAAQLALAFVYLEGTPAVPADKARAYAWADIAAERGYPEFLAVRERLWEALDASEQQRAREVGAKLMSEYGDAVAKRRLEMLLRTGLSRKTGTRTGSQVGALAVVEVDDAVRASMRAGAATHPTADGANAMSLQLGVLFESIAGRANDAYYSDANWDPETYWVHKDRMWRHLEGAVEIAPLQPIERSGRG